MKLVGQLQFENSPLCSTLIHNLVCSFLVLRGRDTQRLRQFVRLTVQFPVSMEVDREAFLKYAHYVISMLAKIKRIKLFLERKITKTTCWLYFPPSYAGIVYVCMLGEGFQLFWDLFGSIKLVTN